jgi:peptide chain release factor 1
MVFDKLDAVEARYDELGQLMSDPEVVTDYTKLQEYGRERSELEERVGAYREYKAAVAARDEAQAIIDEGDDADMIALAQEEVDSLNPQIDALEERLKVLLLPRDKDDDRNVIIEIRAGAGGEEAALFAAELYRMYAKYATTQGWKVDVVSSSESENGGFKEIIFEVAGKGAYSQLKFESGVHRVQRVPVTEANGRIHTSTASVIAMPEAEEMDVEIKPEDIRVDIYRASGHGGQGVNTTDSAVRITHNPTGIVVACQQERSQHKNRATAWNMLRARLYELELKKREEKANAEAAAKTDIGWGHQIRSYVLQPYQLVKDLRTGTQSTDPDEVLDGDLDPFMEASLAQRVYGGGEAVEDID